MDSEGTKTSWESFFNELENEEEILTQAINNLSKVSDSGKFIKTGYKAEEWRSLHNQLSKNGKTIEKVLTIDY